MSLSTTNRQATPTTISTTVSVYADDEIEINERKNAAGQAVSRPIVLIRAMGMFHVYVYQQLLRATTSPTVMAFGNDSHFLFVIFVEQEMCYLGWPHSNRTTNEAIVCMLCIAVQPSNESYFELWILNWLTHSQASTHSCPTVVAHSLRHTCATNIHSWTKLPMNELDEAEHTTQTCNPDVFGLLFVRGLFHMSHNIAQAHGNRRRTCVRMQLTGVVLKRDNTMSVCVHCRRPHECVCVCLCLYTAHCLN